MLLEFQGKRNKGNQRNP